MRATPTVSKSAPDILRSATREVLDRIIRVESSVVGKVEIHTTTYDGGIMRMRQLPGGLQVPAFGEAVLAPGGHHLIFMDVQ